ncbi:MAG: DUF4185 domain-containing protein [Candidatus Promineifilaceae bacterium]
MNSGQKAAGEVAFTRYLGTFPRVQNERWALVGQDGGQSIDLGEATLFVFADTLLALGQPAGKGRRPPFAFGRDEQHYFMANCAAVTSGNGLRGALAEQRYYAEGEAEMPSQILEPTAEEQAAAIRFWPAHGILTDGRVYLYYLGIQQGQSESMWDFRNLGVGLATVDPATGACQRLRQAGEWRFWQTAGDDLHVGVQALRQGDELFVFGSLRHGLTLEAILGRVALAQIGDPAAYRFFRPESGDWVADLGAAGGLGPCGSDYSVSYNAHLGRYLMIYLDSFDKTLWLRTAEAIWGPYSRPRRIGRVPHQPNSDLVYLAFEHPQFAADGGRRVYVSYCQPYFAAIGLVEIGFA